MALELGVCLKPRSYVSIHSNTLILCLGISSKIDLLRHWNVTSRQLETITEWNSSKPRENGPRRKLGRETNGRQERPVLQLSPRNLQPQRRTCVGESKYIDACVDRSANPLGTTPSSVCDSGAGNVEIKETYSHNGEEIGENFVHLRNTEASQRRL